MKQKFFWACLILLVAGFMACSSKDGTIPDTSANITVFNGVPGGQYNIAIDSSFIGDNIGEGESTGYKSFRAQRYKVKIYPAGNRTTPLDSGELSLLNGLYYSVFLSRDHNGTLRLFAREDVLTAPAAGQAKIRIVDLSDTYNSDLDAVNLDFYLRDLKDTSRFKSMSYLTLTAFTSIVAGTFDRDVRYADSSLSLIGNNTPRFTAVDGKITSWIVYGNAMKQDSFKLVEFKHN